MHHLRILDGERVMETERYDFGGYVYVPLDADLGVEYTASPPLLLQTGDSIWE